MEPVKEKSEELAEKNEVIKEELKKTEQKPVPEPGEEKSESIWLGGYILLLICLGILYYLIETQNLGFVRSARLARWSLGAILCVAIIIASQILKIYFIKKIPSKASQYNLKRIVHFVRLLAIVFVIVSILFVNWYTAAVSLGLLSLILGFALQTPITSFIGWIYILLRSPYRVGDRIRIGDATGDELINV